MPCNVAIEHRAGQYLHSVAADQHDIAFVDRERCGIAGWWEMGSLRKFW
jgi:hypothetical protein